MALPLTFNCVVHYLEELPMNHEILRKISCLCSRLPVLDSHKFESEFYAVSAYSVY